MVKDISIKQGATFDPRHDPSIKLKAIDVNDGDITQQIQVVKNTVDTLKPGEYKVTYSVKNSKDESDQKTIKVTVLEREAKPVVDDHWENGDIKGWKFFSGEEIKLEKDPDNALEGNWVFYNDQHAAISKEIQLQKGQKYQVSVCVKPKDKSLVASHYVKVTLKADHASKDSRVIFSTPLSQGKSMQKGYRMLTAEFTASENEIGPLFIVENFNAGWIGSIKITIV